MGEWTHRQNNHFFILLFILTGISFALYDEFFKDWSRKRLDAKISRRRSKGESLVWYVNWLPDGYRDNVITVRGTTVYLTALDNPSIDYMDKVVLRYSQGDSDSAARVDMYKPGAWVPHVKNIYKPYKKAHDKELENQKRTQMEEQKRHFGL